MRRGTNFSYQNDTEGVLKAYSEMLSLQPQQLRERVRLCASVQV